MAGLTVPRRFHFGEGMETVIRALRVPRGTRRKVEVVLDDHRRLRLAPVLAARLNVGQSISGDDLERLRREDETEEAYQSALGLVARRPRSELELRRSLERRKLSADQQAAVLARLAAAGLVDDRAFAAAWVENRRAFRPRSSVGLRTELRRKGVPADSIAAALAEHDDDSAARSVLERRWARWAALPWEELRRQATQYLVRQGFDYETVKRAVRDRWDRAADENREESP